MRRPITASDLRGIPGLRKAAAARIVEAQPTTVLEALRLPFVGRSTTQALMEAGLLVDPEGAQHRARTDEELGLARADARHRG